MLMNFSAESANSTSFYTSEAAATAASFRARLDAATMALLQTRDHVVRALDAHLAELHGLRHQLAEAEQKSMIQSAAPLPPPSFQPAPPSAALPPPLPQQPVAVQQAHPSVLMYDPPAPPPPAPLPPEPVLAALQGLQEALLHKAPVTPAPMPMSEVFPDRLPDFTEVPPVAASPFSLPPVQRLPQHEMPLASRPLVAPHEVPLASRPLLVQPNPQQMMSFQTAFTTVAQEAGHLSTPMQPAPLSRPLPPSPIVHPPVVTQVTLPPASGAMRAQISLPPSREMAREVAADPRMEQATLEDLNAALAFAFSQAAQPSRPLMAEATGSSRPLAPAAQWTLPPRA